MAAPSSNRERSALRLSLAVAGAVAGVAVVWGLAANSQVILFDGVYTLLGMSLTGLSIAAARVSRRPPSARYPFGLEAVVPLAVGAQGLALLGVIAYAALEAVRVLLAGGAEVAAAAVAGYGAFTAILSLAVHRWMRAADPTSDLLDAEAQSWWAGMLLSAVVLVGALLALGLRWAGLEGAERYVDPVLVLVASVILLPVPVGMIRDTAVEILEGTPAPGIMEPVARAVAEVQAELGLPDPILRVTKLGRKLYVEADFVVPDGVWDIAGEDRVRRAVDRRLAALPYDVWLNVGLTTDPELAR